MNYTKILDSKNYIISEILIKELIKYDLNIKEFLLIVYFYNAEVKILNISDIEEKFALSEKEILESFNSLLDKKLIRIKVEENNGKINETVCLDKIFNEMIISLKQDEKEEEKINVFDMIETEFARKLSPIEYEIVNTWLNENISEELIIGALKEAVYNGVKNFRYIDKIIYEWGKKGFKTMDDVQKHLKERNQKKEENKELFDYDWLDDDEI